MLNKKDFLKYASTLAFPIMIQNLISTLVNIADTVMLGYVSQTAMSASSLANQYTFVLFCIYYGMATGTSVLCAQYSSVRAVPVIPAFFANLLKKFWKVMVASVRLSRRTFTCSFASIA